MKWNGCDAPYQDRGQRLAARPVVRSDPLLRYPKHPRPRRELVSSVCRRRHQIRVLCRFPPSLGPLPSSVERLILITFSNSGRVCWSPRPRPPPFDTHSANLHAPTPMWPQHGATRRAPRSDRECLGISFNIMLAVTNAKCAIGLGPVPSRFAQECGHDHGS